MEARDKRSSEQERRTNQNSDQHSTSRPRTFRNYTLAWMIHDFHSPVGNIHRLQKVGVLGDEGSVDGAIQELGVLQHAQEERLQKSESNIIESGKGGGTQNRGGATTRTCHIQMSSVNYSRGKMRRETERRRRLLAPQDKKQRRGTKG